MKRVLDSIITKQLNEVCRTTATNVLAEKTGALDGFPIQPTTLERSSSRTNQAAHPLTQVFIGQRINVIVFKQHVCGLGFFLVRAQCSSRPMPQPECIHVEIEF
jgi:hypothetical protein